MISLSFYALIYLDENCFETIYYNYGKECVCSINSCPEDSSTLPAQSFR